MHKHIAPQYSCCGVLAMNAFYYNVFVGCNNAVVTVCSKENERERYREERERGRDRKKRKEVRGIERLDR